MNKYSRSKKPIRTFTRISFFGSWRNVNNLIFQFVNCQPIKALLLTHRNTVNYSSYSYQKKSDFRLKNEIFFHQSL